MWKFSGLPADVVDFEGIKSLSVVLGHRREYIVHLNANNISASAGFMLVDLSDTVNWPHTNTGHVNLTQIIIGVNPSTTTAFTGDLHFGFLQNVDATNGDLYQIGTLHGERANPIQGDTFDFSTFGLDLEPADIFGPITANDTTWQTDVNLQGPDDNVLYPSGDGDFVMKVDMSAGTIDISITLMYTTYTSE